MKAYIINLPTRPDRWKSLTPQLAQLDYLEFIRVEAISSVGRDFTESNFVTPGVAATWASHQKAFRLFLDTTDSHAVIFEDDFEIHQASPKMIKKSLYIADFDFIQLGYLTLSPRKRLEIFASNYFDYLLRTVNRILEIRMCPPFSLKNKVLLRERVDVPRSLVMNDIREGGHAYLVSRNFAEAMLQANSPAFLSTDGLFMAISWMRSFKMARQRKSLFRQSNSPTSVKERVLRKAV